MANYDFSTLNSSDLEELVCDLLNADQPDSSPVKYRTFKEGKDKGIDILYSIHGLAYEHVGQVKHYYKTGYTGLIYTLQKYEVAKVKKLNPNKYILATSVDLGVSDAQAIEKLFNPFIKSLDDVYGKKDLNRLLEKYPKVLDNHYKLWFSDTSVLLNLLRSEMDFRSSAFTENELKRRLRIYVKTSLFDKARKSLRENKFIVITGEPGVGKTSLAEMLVYEYIAEGYKLTYILDEIKEAEKVLTPDSRKQIIYFDDFLGSNAVEMNKARGSETSLRKVLRTVSAMPDTLIVFTTRSFLLNTAIEESENLKRFNIKAKESILELSEYSNDIKRALLNNHIEDCELRVDLKEVLSKKEVQDFITSHANFSPRSVEFITTKDVVNDFTAAKFIDFIYSSFNTPSEIWKHAYSEQIREDDRILLNTLLSFGTTATIEELEKAFLNRIDLEVRTNNKRKEINCFTKSLRRLNGGFIIDKKHRNTTEIQFINPSLVDFLVDYIRVDSDEVRRIAESVVFTSQLTTRLFALSLVKEIEVPKSLEERLINNYTSFITDDYPNLDLIRLALVISKYIKTKEAEVVVCQILDEIDDWGALYDDYSLNFHFREFMESVRGNYRINSIIESKIVEIVTELIVGDNEINSAIKLLEELITKYDIRLGALDTAELDYHFEQLLTDYIEQEIDWLKDYMTNQEEADEKREELNSLIDRLDLLGLDVSYGLHDFDNVDWEEVATENEFRRLMDKDD